MGQLYFQEAEKSNLAANQLWTNNCTTILLVVISRITEQEQDICTFL